MWPHCHHWSPPKPLYCTHTCGYKEGDLGMHKKPWLVDIQRDNDRPPQFHNKWAMNYEPYASIFGGQLRRNGIYYEHYWRWQPTWTSHIMHELEDESTFELAHELAKFSATIPPSTNGGIYIFCKLPKERRMTIQHHRPVQCSRYGKTTCRGGHCQWGSGIVFSIAMAGCNSFFLPMIVDHVHVTAH